MAVPESLLSVTTLPSSDWQVEATQAFREAGMFTQSLEEGEWHLDLQTQKEAHSWPSKQCEVKQGGRLAEADCFRRSQQ